MTIIAASIPVLRTLFRDLQTLSRRLYESGRHGTQVGSQDAEDVEMSAAPVEKTMTGSSHHSQTRDSCGQILQRTEFVVTVEYCNGHEDKGHYETQRV